MAARAKFTPAPDLELKAARLVVDAIDHVAADVERVAKQLAPPTKKWQSVGDGAVRRQHREADGQEIPDNLRFDLTAYEWDVKHPGRIGPLQRRGNGGGWNGPDARLMPGRHTWLRFPRDPTGGAYVAIVNCRCSMLIDPDGIAKLISRDRARIEDGGRKVTALVHADGKWVVKAEVGDVYDGGRFIAPGTFYMSRAASSVAALRRARR